MQMLLPLDQMTIAEKLEAINQIWDDLLRNPHDVSSPDWHNEVISARAERVKRGQAQFKDLEGVKYELRWIFKGGKEKDGG